MFKEIFDNSPVAKILVNEDSEIQLVNRYAAKLFGYSKEELVGKDIAKLIPEDARIKHPSLVKNYFDSPLPRLMGYGRDLFGVKKDQTKFPIEVGLTPIQTDDKLLVMSSIIDITERVRAEERFKAAVDAAPNGMILINSKGYINLVNKKTEEIFGYKKKELLNQPIEILVPEELKNPHPTFVKSYIDQPEPRAMGSGRELFGKHKSGRLVPVEIGLQPVYFEDEVFVISSIVDITQRKIADKEIADKTEEIREFSYRTSHDLKTPLLSLGALADCVLEDLEAKNIELASKNLSKVKRLATKLNRLVEDILTLTKTDVDGEKQSYFDFQNYLDDVTERFSHILENSGVQLKGNFLHNKKLLTQKTRLTQVLDNLISNGVKYSDPEKNQRLVQISTFNETNHFHIRIEDNGVGIPTEKHQEVFGMFKRFHKGQAEGSGLGLYMIKKHIEKLNAQIKFESAPKGTTFYIELPI